MARMSIEERGRAVGMVAAGSSLRQVSVLIKIKKLTGNLLLSSETCCLSNSKTFCILSLCHFKIAF